MLVIAEGFIGRKADRPARWFVPKQYRARFAASGGRTMRAATEQEIAAWVSLGTNKPVALRILEPIIAKQAVPPPAEAEASVNASAGTSSAPRRRGRK